MKIEVPLRITVNFPVPGVAMQLQKGRDELVMPILSTPEEMIFDLNVSADLSGSEINFLGKFTQGPKIARFIYINSGTMAGQFATCWTRRAKISLMSISREQIETVAADNSLLLKTEINGVARDGGPVCASVKLVEWKVTTK